MARLISEDKARRVFTQLGYKTAGDWDRVSLAKKLKHLPETIGESTKLEDASLQEIITDVQNGKEVKLKELEIAETQKGAEMKKNIDSKKKTEKKEEVAKPKTLVKASSLITSPTKEKIAKKENKTSKPAEKKKATDKKSSKAGSGLYNGFNPRPGSFNHTVYSFLNKKGNTIAEISKGAKVPEKNVRNIMAWLCRIHKATFVEKTNKYFKA